MQKSATLLAALLQTNIQYRIVKARYYNIEYRTKINEHTTGVGMGLLHYLIFPVHYSLFLSLN